MGRTGRNVLGPCRGRRAAALGAVAVVLTLAACTAGPDPQPTTSTPQITTPTTTSAAPTTTPPPPPTTSAPPPATAAATPVGLLPGRTLTWSAEFDGPAGGALPEGDWDVADGGGGFGNNELEVYTPRPQNVSTTGWGTLALTALAEQASGDDGTTGAYTSGRIQTVPAFLYGHIEARIKVPAGSGLWPAFWAIGQYSDGVEWPAVGEFDVMETTNKATGLSANVHGPDGNGDPYQVRADQPIDGSLAADWHVYSVDWTQDDLSFAIDGNEFHSVDRADLQPGQQWVFDHPFNLVLDLAVGGDWPGTPEGDSAFPATMQVDWVRVYDSQMSRP